MTSKPSSTGGDDVAEQNKAIEYAKLQWPVIILSITVLLVTLFGYLYLNHRASIGNARQAQNNARFEATATCVTKVVTLILSPPPNPPPTRAQIHSQILADCKDLVRIQPNKSAP
jgi:hypothetical protein